eukprot:GEZU01016119.1.p2 GENE.GEZU01016119.1~~GEZU01016119.1.p2  ORF type:complete len:126 (-),score=4.91 GEZU01016119.1:86-463(-)
MTMYKNKKAHTDIVFDGRQAQGHDSRVGLVVGAQNLVTSVKDFGDTIHSHCVFNKRVPNVFLFGDFDRAGNNQLIDGLQDSQKHVYDINTQIQHAEEFSEERGPLVWKLLFENDNKDLRELVLDD